MDHGVGVPPDEQDAVFDKFVQSSKTRTVAGGTGLGLSICREIVEAQHGRIWCDNHPEGGAVFQVILPRTMKENPTGEQPETTRRKENRRNHGASVAPGGPDAGHIGPFIDAILNP